ncbi:hypothetical protein Lokhon_02536 [Limimaricola hongkongensis DSM 17492]|uniref:Uncharacterized protein n=1 Tax=Limimaricola hongkongensis DSM 17492 TaxID=1122180 RepID=A0A017H8S0_9RHOB|nr:hypothetical protein Lokhon_02536 [Limimaricola hongkongensis DSM 17492]
MNDGLLGRSGGQPVSRPAGGAARGVVAKKGVAPWPEASGTVTMPHGNGPPGLPGGRPPASRQPALLALPSSRPCPPIASGRPPKRRVKLPRTIRVVLSSSQLF